MEPRIYEQFMRFDSVPSLWAALTRTYGHTRVDTRIYSVFQEISTARQGDRSVYEYFTFLSGRFQELSYLEPLSAFPHPEDLLVAKRRQEKRETYQFLMGLRPEFEQIRVQIVSMNPLPDILDAYSMVEEHEYRARLTTVSSVPATVPLPDHSALASGRSSSVRGGGGGGRTSTPVAVWVAAGARLLLFSVSTACGLVTRGPGAGYSFLTCVSSLPLLLMAQVQQLQSQLQQQSSFQPPSAQPLPTSSSFSSTSASASGTSTALHVTHEGHSSPWVIDSGATDHMTGEPHFFSSLVSPSVHWQVRLADGSVTPILHQGTVPLSPSFTLGSVLHVPKLALNLLSVSQLTRALHCSVTFFPSGCVFQDLTTKRTFGYGRERDGLYQLDLPPQTSPPVLPPPSTAAATTSSLWHARLGHANPKIVSSLFPSVSFEHPFQCDVCQLSKHTRTSYPVSISRSSAPFEIVHSDVWGPAPIVSYDGFRYFVSFIDDFTRCCWVYLMRAKSDVFYFYTQFSHMVATQFSSRIQILRSDNGGEYTSSSFSAFLASQGTLHQFSCPYTPEQNGLAERKNRHLLNVTRCLLLGSHVPKLFWSAALLTGTFLVNRLPCQPLAGRIPLSLLSPSRPLFPIPLRVFGCVTFHSMDVTFFEDTPFYSIPPPSQPAPVPLPPSTPPQPAPVPLAPLHDSIPAQTYTRGPRGPSHVHPILRTPLVEPSSQDLMPYPLTGDVLPSSDLPIALRKGKRSCVTDHPVASFVSYQRLSPGYRAFLTATDQIRIPHSTAEAFQHPEWVTAMEAEMSALQRAGTWRLVPLPTGKKTVGCRWVYTIKYNADGSLARYKARLVAKGFTQTPADYGVTFAPVAKLSIVRLLVSLAACLGWPLHQLDVLNAFLNGSLNEEIYMDPPPGYELQGEYLGRVCLLLMALCHADHICFVRTAADGRMVIILVYVDDIILTGDDSSGILQIKEVLRTTFEVKDLGPLKYFLGIEVARSKQGISLSQRKYTLDLLSDTGLLGCSPVSTPMDPNHRLHAESGDPLPDQGRYQRLVGRLIYLTNTRPDISFAVSVVSQFMHAPRTSHLDAVFRILHYLKGSPGLGLFYRSDVYVLCGNLISWKSKKQSVVSRSSAEAEYRAMAHGATELLWLRTLLTELGFPPSGSSTLVCDNQSALMLASDSVLHERTKHIEVDIHFLREHIRSGTLATTYVPSAEQTADAFTKAVGPSRLLSTYGKLGLLDLFAPA
ncbi:hypothetical protein KSP39_PZI002048 [Platanthera zijinensis]|uniref:Integrase catalytic domain-containing protein n=1 Tax=Platanthera zijinensis TaxID=2320716 RepID=A0AAP0BZ20_9ASPA